MAAVVSVLRFFLLASFRYLSMMPFSIFSIACTLFYVSFGLLISRTAIK